MIRMLAKRYQLNEETLLAVVTDVFGWIHEISYKKRVSEAIRETYWIFGPEIAWHLFGIIMDAFENEEYCQDAKGELLTEMQYFDVQMLKRSRTILDKWDIEKKFEFELE
jgi:hypothetical protein